MINDNWSRRRIARIASNPILLNFGRTRPTGRSSHGIGDGWTPSSEEPAATPWRTRFTHSPYWRLRPIDTQSGSPNSRYVKRPLPEFRLPDRWGFRRLVFPPLAGAQMTQAAPSLDPSGIALALPRVGGALNRVFGNRLTSLPYHQPDHIGEKVPFLLGELTIYGFGFSGSLVPSFTVG